MKFIKEMTEKRKLRNEAIRKQRTRGGSVRVRNPSTKSRPSRRSSLGVLPGAIGIGSGAVLDYNTNPQHPVTSKFIVFPKLFCQ